MEILVIYGIHNFANSEEELFFFSFNFHVSLQNQMVKFEIH